jgi:hypothetical protein
MRSFGNLDHREIGYMRTISRSSDAAGDGIQRHEAGAGIAELAGLFLIFIVAFSGRDRFGDNVKTLLTILTYIVGGLGVGAGLAVLRRGFTTPRSRVARIVLGAVMVFAGAYSIVHVATS